MAAAPTRTLGTAIQTAEALARRGDWLGALACYRAILQDAVKGEDGGLPNLKPYLLVMDRFADLAVPLGYVRAGRELLTAIATLSSAAGDLYARDYSAVKRMLMETGAGDVADANATLQSLESTLGPIDQIDFSALADWELRRFWPLTNEADRAVLFSQLYLAMGTLLASFGSFGEALQSFRRGLAFTGEAMPDLARRAGPVLRVAIAAALVEKGDLSEARDELEPLTSAADEFAEPALCVRIHEIRAKLRLLRGDFGPAEADLERIVRVAADRAFEVAEARARLNLAQMLIFLNKTREAQENVDRADSIARARGDEAMLARAAALRAAGRARVASLAESISIAGSVARMWLGEPETVPTEGSGLPSSLDLPQAANHLAFFEDRLLAAHWQLGQGSVSAARTLFAEMRQTFQHTDSRLIAMRLDAFGALLCYYEQNYQAAIASLRKLLPAYAGLSMKPELWQLQRVLGWCLARTSAPRPEQEQLTLLSETLLEEITSTLAPEDQAIYNLNKWTTDEEYLAAEIDDLVSAKKCADASPAPLRLYRRLQLVRRIHALSQKIDRYKEQPAAGSPLAHPAHAATLKFLVLPDRVLVIERTRFRLRFGVSPISRLQLRGLVRAWHEWTTGLRQGDFAAESAAVARDIGAALQMASALDPLSTRVKTLRIIPDDSLHGFPFAVLKYKNRFLVERFNLSIHGSERKPRRRARTKPGKALFAGVSTEVPGFPALTMAGEELSPFRRWTGKIPLTELRNETATRDSLARELQSATFAHVACHGTYVPNNPDATGLVLAPHPPAHEVLSISDVAHLKFEGLEHLTLSACWSADNFVLPGRWVVSFPQHFQLAGARTVLACLWEVEQGFAAQFFARYYSYLADFSPAEALARTQRDAIGNRLTSTDPIYWAGYRIYGGRD